MRFRVETKDLKISRRSYAKLLLISPTSTPSLPAFVGVALVVASSFGCQACQLTRKMMNLVMAMFR